MKRSPALTRRTPLPRGKGLARGKPLARGTRLAPVNRERKAKTFTRNFGERRAVVGTMPCLVLTRFRLDSGAPAVMACKARREGAANRWAAWFSSPSRCDLAAWGPNGSQAAHAKARGMGGAKGDRRDLIPLCPKHHRESGEFRTSQRAKFEERYAISLVDEAARIAAELDERGLP